MGIPDLRDKLDLGRGYEGREFNASLQKRR
jgi:hypothetical protein